MPKPVQDVTPAEWDRTMAVTLPKTFLCLQAEAAYMARHDDGAIVNIDSG
ncbi:SDR family NAD(P)-dependent oxidoreductase [Arthrobacter sp. A5]